MLIAVIADDLTGAADAGVQLVHAGYRTAVFFRATEVLADDLDAVAFDTDSRAMPAGFAAKRVLEAARAASEARIVYKKLDSTLRGNVAAELAAALGGARRDRAVVAPAFPAAGRTTVGGTQLVHGVPVDETEMANDPDTPVREAHVPGLLADAFSSVGALGVDDLADPELFAEPWRRTNASSPMRSATPTSRRWYGPCQTQRGYSGPALPGSRSRSGAFILGPAREPRACKEPRSVLYSSSSGA